MRSNFNWSRRRDESLSAAAQLQRRTLVSRLLSRLGIEGIAYAVSVFTVVEVSREPGLYDRLIDWFSVLPNVLLKNTTQLLEEEIKSYPDPRTVDPVLICPVGVRPESGYSRVETLRKLFRHPTILQLADQMASDRQSILDSLLALTKNYPRPEGGYSKPDVRSFAEMVALQQVAARDATWVRLLGQLPDAAAFPSIKAAAYSAFFKFYSDPSRRPRMSDSLDLGIASGLPYVDIAALESDQANTVRTRIAAVDPLNILRCSPCASYRKSRL